MRRFMREPNLQRFASIDRIALSLGTLLMGFLTACAQPEIMAPAPVSTAAEGRFPTVEIVNVFLPPGESNVRSSFRLEEGVGLIGTEETGDIFKTEDSGMSWRKVVDGGEQFGLDDVRNFIRAQDGNIYISTSEPASVVRSDNEGEFWLVIAGAKATRTVGLVQLDDETFLVGLRRAMNKRTSIIRSEDYFDSVHWIPVSDEKPPQNVTCFGYWGGSEVLAGVGYEASGKVYKSIDRGLTWSKKGEFADARDMMNFFKYENDIYVLASGVATLFKSSDNGESWIEARQFWKKGFLAACVPFTWNDKTYWVMAASDQTKTPFRHLVLISDNPGGEWFEWIELMQDQTGGANNICVLDANTLVVGTGNHSAQGRAFTLRVKN